MIACRLFTLSHRRRQSTASSRANYPSSRRSNSPSLSRHPQKRNTKTATINNTSVLCVQELICCTAAANSATKLQTNASGLQLRKNCVSHAYKEHIHSANALRNTRVQNKDAKVLTVFCFMGQNACSQSQHHLDRSFKTQRNLHRRTLQSQPQKLVKVFCR